MSKIDIMYFNDQWLSDSRFSSWIEKCGSNTSARCKVCCKVIYLSSMGVSSLVSHASEKKHKEKLASQISPASLKAFMEPYTSVVNVESSSSKVAPSKASHSGTLDQYVSQTVRKAKILWTLIVVMSKLSLRSCEQLKDLFQVMFNDSEIASDFKLGKTKCGYYITYDVAPYFQDQIIQVLKKSPCFSMSFDESLNKVFQVEQIDLNIKVLGR